MLTQLPDLCFKKIFSFFKPIELLHIHGICKRIDELIESNKFKNTLDETIAEIKENSQFSDLISFILDKKIMNIYDIPRLNSFLLKNRKETVYFLFPTDYMLNIAQTELSFLLSDCSMIILFNQWINPVEMLEMARKYPLHIVALLSNKNCLIAIKEKLITIDDITKTPNPLYISALLSNKGIESLLNKHISAKELQTFPSLLELETTLDRLSLDYKENTI